MSDSEQNRQRWANELKALRARIAQLQRERDKYKQIVLSEQERKDTLGDLFENTSDLIFSITSKGRFLYVNRAWIDTLQ